IQTPEIVRPLLPTPILKNEDGIKNIGGIHEQYEWKWRLRLPVSRCHHHSGRAGRDQTLGSGPSQGFRPTNTGPPHALWRAGAGGRRPPEVPRLFLFLV